MLVKVTVIWVIEVQAGPLHQDILHKQGHSVSSG